MDINKRIRFAYIRYHTWSLFKNLIIGGLISLYVKHWHARMSQLMRIWYLSHRRTSKAQASLRFRAVSPGPSLFAHTRCGSRRRVRPKTRHLAPTGWLRMRVWKMSLRRTKSTIISWAGSNYIKSSCKIMARLRLMPHSDSEYCMTIEGKYP